jgi:hypothetical protein
VEVPEPQAEPKEEVEKIAKEYEKDIPNFKTEL